MNGAGTTGDPGATVSGPHRSGPSWHEVELAGTVGELHSVPWPLPVRRTVWHMAPARPALVLGSTQRHLVGALTDPAAAAGWDLVVRASGGGAVLVEPGSMLWIDVVLPRHDLLWVDDVGRSALWLGEVWATALAGLGLEVRVDRGPYDSGKWGTLVCFAGSAAGEVFAADRGAGGGGKVVGISQRRTRHGARFQTMLHLDAGSARMADVLTAAVDADEAEDLAVAVASSRVPVPFGAVRIRSAFGEALARSTT